MFPHLICCDDLLALFNGAGQGLLVTNLILMSLAIYILNLSDSFSRFFLIRRRNILVVHYKYKIIYKSTSQTAISMTVNIK